MDLGRERIGHYRIVRPLGAGGMGEVFLAEDTRLDRPVALKLLPRDLAEDARRRHRFTTEAKAASALNHPNVCIIHEVGETADGRPFLAMEYVQGRTLDVRLREAPFELAEVIEIGVQAADALEAAHAKGIIHRDIKPSNISLNERGQIKILDFGLAKRTSVEAATREPGVSELETQDGQVLGTPHYMSPEQALGGEVDARSDVFSLGVVLYELATRRSPFAGSGFGDTLNRIINQPPGPLGAQAVAAGEGFERVVLKCLAKQSALRYQTARELKADLASLQLWLARHRGESGVAGPILAPAAMEAVRQAAGVARPAALGSPDAGSERVEELPGSDIFISYAKVDDQPILGGRQGWVSQFYRNLELRIEQLSGVPVRIWRHPNPPGDSVLDDRILAGVRDVRAMISVVSPPFIKSGGCRREVEEFWQAAERSGTLQIENQSRIFKVVKTPIEPDEVPPHLSGMFSRLSGFDFFEQDPRSGRFREFSEEFGDEARRSFLEKIYDLAYEIRHVLKAYDPGKPRVRELATGGGGKVVYLAEATSDLRAERDQLRRELQERGFLVLPDSPLPLIRDEFVVGVKAALARADAVVHLLGARYGMIPEGADVSQAELQVGLSSEGAGDRRPSRYIWVPPGLVCEDDRQSRFLKSLRESGVGLEHTEMLAGSIEQLKGLVIKQLTAPPPVARPLPAAAAPMAPRIYLVCDRQDEEAVEPIEDFLYEQGFEVKLPVFDGDEQSFLQIHQENLKLCDAALIYFGQASLQWVEFKLLDLLKAPGYGRTKPWLGQAIYLAPPDHRRKQRLRPRSVEVIREGSGFQPGLLQAFVTRLRSGPGASS